MRYICTIILAIALLIACMSCGSRSGKLVEKQAIEQKQREETKKKEMEYGVSPIVVMHNTAVYKVLNDTVALRIHDNAYFVRRKDKKLKDWRYFRVE